MSVRMRSGRQRRLEGDGGSVCDVFVGNGVGAADGVRGEKASGPWVVEVTFAPLSERFATLGTGCFDKEQKLHTEPNVIEDTVEPPAMLCGYVELLLLGLLMEIREKGQMHPLPTNLDDGGKKPGTQLFVGT